MRILVGFSVSDSMLSRGIRWITGSDVSHAFFLIKTNVGPVVYQAMGNGPELVSLASFRKNGNQIVRARRPVVDLTAAVLKSIAKYDALYGYDFEADVSDGLNGLAAKVGLQWRVDWHQKHASECSALVVRTMLLADPPYPGIGKLDPALVTPGQLDKFMASQWSCIREAAVQPPQWKPRP